MKKIRGGVAVEGRPTKCSMQCDTGAYEPEIEVECRDWISNATHCETSATIGIMCYTPDGVAHTVRSCMYPRNK